MFKSSAWSLEAFSILGSALALIGMVILLAECDRKPIFSWHGVSLNTIISILSTASKACLLLTVDVAISQWKWIMFSHECRVLNDFGVIDSASRGPLGSLRLLWKLRGLNWTVRSGAIVIILSLAIDPFSQQLVQLKQEVVYTSDSATSVNRAVKYFKGSLFFLTQSDNGIYSSDWATADADYLMQSSVYSGLSRPEDDVFQQLNFTCSTGNCTWERPVESLAVRSRCVDLASVLEKREDNGGLIASFEVIRGPSGPGQRAYRLPNGLVIDNYNTFTFPDTDDELASYYPGILMTAFGTGDPNLTNSMQDLDTLIWATNFLKVQHPPDKYNRTRWPDLPMQALECGLYYCINRYIPSIKQSILKESTENISFSRAPISWSLLFSPNLDSPDSDDLMLTANNQSYNITQTAVYSISSFFQSLYTSHSSLFNQSKHPDIIEGRLNGFYVWNAPQWQSHSSFQYSPSVMQVFWSEQDIPALFRAIARSMSNAIRDGADDDTKKTVTGSTGVLTTHYHVQWGWIAMHFAVFLSGLGFLIATMVRSRRASPTVLIPVWKDDALAALNFGSQLGPIFGSSDNLKEMEEVAATKVGRLQLKSGNTTATECDVSHETLILERRQTVDNLPSSLVLPVIRPMTPIHESLND
ncbi:hypothetical protein G7054_g2526 [Neopestalotiopsis clavispora]|nr:hypothetical protein G7054_g2526 [Neopestalotiopsis clavispora]